MTLEHRQAHPAPPAPCSAWRLRGVLLAALLPCALLVADRDAAGAPEHGQNFKNWTAGCEKPEGAETERCYIFQNLVLKEGGQRVLHIAIGYLASSDKPAAIVTFPLGISLPPGVHIKVDEGEIMRFAIERCHANGCVGAIPLSDELIAAMKKGEQARIGFYDNNRREIGVPVSLTGFTAGFNSLRE